MTIEDNLSPAQRIRLEALAQAIAWCSKDPGLTTRALVGAAAIFEKWIATGEQESEHKPLPQTPIARTPEP